MTKKDFDIESLKSIHELYEFMEKNALSIERNSDITDLLVEYRNQTQDADEKQKVQWELECFLFHIVGKNVFAFSYSTGASPGDHYEYPLLDEHQTAAFDYLKQRAEHAVSPLLTSRYNHLLWKGLKGIKHREYAIKAIDSYISLIEHYIGLFNSDDDSEITFQITRKMECLAQLVAEHKHKTAEIIALTRQLLFDTTKMKFYTKHSLLETMLDSPGLFDKNSFENSLSLFEGEIEISGKAKTDNFMLAKTYFPTAIKIASKLGTDSKIWNSKIGDAYTRMGDAETEPERNWLKLQDYALAIQHYRQSGDATKREELENKYAETKEDVSLPTARFDYTEEHIAGLKLIEEEIKEKADNLLKEHPDKVYEFITKGSFFPTKEFIDSKGAITESWLKGITTVKFDRNKNIESVSTSEENDDDWLFWYKYYIRHVVDPTLYHIFIPGIRSGALTFTNLISFLARNTWLGATLTKKDVGGEIVQYNWISLVAPSLVEFFVQMQSSLASRDYKPNFILAIDSITPKFEGLIREFCIRIKTPTSTGNRGTMQEMYINQLLAHPTIKNSFNEDDRLLFDFLFTKEKGLNLRNNIAHCYFDYSDYSYQYMHLWIAALLRIGKYNFSIQNKES